VSTAQPCSPVPGVRDPNFEAQIRQALLVYEQVALPNTTGGLGLPRVTLSIDEKPEGQAIANHRCRWAPPARQAPHRGPRSRVQTLGHKVDLGGLDLHKARGSGVTAVGSSSPCSGTGMIPTPNYMIRSDVMGRLKWRCQGQPLPGPQWSTLECCSSSYPLLKLSVGDTSSLLR
jgi:hypothetical protein